MCDIITYVIRNAASEGGDVSATFIYGAGIAVVQGQLGWGPCYGQTPGGRGTYQPAVMEKCTWTHSFSLGSVLRALGHSEVLCGGEEL